MHRSEQSKRLLYFAHSFPPAASIAAVRTWNTVKYLSALGWKVTVVTPKADYWLEINSAASANAELARYGIERIETGHITRFLIPDYFKSPRSRIGRIVSIFTRKMLHAVGIETATGWTLSVLRMRKEILKKKYDVVMSTGSPFFSFWLASHFARKGRSPYVLDYRDPWHGHPHERPNAKRFSKGLEANLQAGASAIIVVSESWAKLITVPNHCESKSYVVPNGFDAEVDDQVTASRFDHFAIVYTGVLYPPKRVLDPVFHAMAKLLDSGTVSPGSLQFHYYGSHGDLVRDAAQRCGCESAVVIHGRVSRAESFAATKGAGLSVVVTSIYPSTGLVDDGIIPGKVFECLGMRRPILGLAPEGSDFRKIIERAGLGRCFTGDEIGAIAEYIRNVHSGNTPPERDRDAFSWSQLACEVDKILSQTLAYSLK